MKNKKVIDKNDIEIDKKSNSDEEDNNDEEEDDSDEEEDNNDEEEDDSDEEDDNSDGMDIDYNSDPNEEVNQKLIQDVKKALGNAALDDNEEDDYENMDVSQINKDFNYF